MILLAVLSVWVVLATIMCLALACAAARPVPANDLQAAAAGSRALSIHPPLLLLQPTCPVVPARNSFRRRSLGMKSLLVENRAA